MTQILPMLDEETGAEPRILSASIADPYVLLMRDDSSVLIAQMDNTNYELEEVEKTGKALSSTKWVAGCLYTDTKGTFQQLEGDKGTSVSPKVMMFLLSQTGALHVSGWLIPLGCTGPPPLTKKQVYALSDLSEPVFVAEGLTYAPPFLSADYTLRRGMARESFSEILVADVGDAVTQSPYLIVRIALLLVPYPLD